jgi:AraC-like DNA-binding protein
LLLRRTVLIFLQKRGCASRASPYLGEVVAMAAAISKSGIDVLGDLPWGEHFCLFYETKEDLLGAVVPYFKAGFDSNEFCVWAVSEPLTEAEALTALRRAIPGFDRNRADPGIEIIPGHEWYLQGDIVDPKVITDGWHEKLSRALVAGYDGLRVSGNAFWLGTEYWQDFHDYEEELRESVAGQLMILLCTYPLAESHPSDILDVARAHKHTLARRKGVWEIIWSAAADDRGLQSGLSLRTIFERDHASFRHKSTTDTAKRLVIAGSDESRAAPVTPPDPTPAAWRTAANVALHARPRLDAIGTVEKLAPAPRPHAGLSPGALRRVCEFVDAHLSERPDLAMLAAVAGVSKHHFARGFKQSVGVTPHHYLVQKRVERALDMLAHTDLSLSEIAHAAGFSDQSHLARHFRQMLGVTPGQFRWSQR